MSEPNKLSELNKYTLLKPFELNGKQVTELVLDMNAISTEEFLSAIDEAENIPKATPSRKEALFPFVLLAKMNGVIFYDLVSHLRGGDAVVIIRSIKSFL